MFLLSICRDIENLRNLERTRDETQEARGVIGYDSSKSYSSLFVLYKNLTPVS